MKPTVTITAASLITQRGPLPPPLVADIIGEIAAQLTAWNHRGQVYGTVQPSDVDMILDSGDLVAMSLSGFPSPPEVFTPSLLLDNSRFIDPHLLTGAAFDHAADAYALACTAFELLTAAPPFIATSVAELIAATTAGAVQQDPRITPTVAAVFATALDPRRDARPRSAQALAQTLREAMERDTP